VVPCNRSLTKEFLRPISKDVQIYVVNDNTEDVPIDNDSGKNIRRMREIDQDSFFENEYHRSKFFTRRSSGCRNVGILQAWKDGADIIINMDDDIIVQEDYVSEYERILGGEKEILAETVQSNKKWFNTIGSSDFFARGIPYEDRIEYTWDYTNACEMKPRVHMGIWYNVLDYNGIDKIANTINGTDMDSSTPFEDGIFYPYEKYIPICAMNVGARRDSAMALLQIPMGHEFYSQYKLYRIEDIWGGYLWQSLFKNTTTFGSPVVKHLKVGNLNWEVAVENYANVLAKEFEGAIDECMVGIIDRPQQWERYHDLAWHLDRYANGTFQFEHNPCPPYFRKFVYELSRTLDCWEKMFQNDRNEK